jgi:hypothetical protein
MRCTRRHHRRAAALAPRSSPRSHSGQRPSTGFWVCAGIGCALVLAFAAIRGGGRLVPADGLLLLAVRALRSAMSPARACRPR